VVAHGLTDNRNALVKCPFIFNCSWLQVGVLSIPRDKNVKGLRSGDRGVCITKDMFLRTYRDMNFILCFVVGELTPEIYIYIYIYMIFM
jgi:hypothetical protein